jgi:sulfotransferase family protein
MSIRRVLVVGYPKSGNTWLTRLTAELTGAPVRGFWGEPHAVEIAVEGAWRGSDIEVYKGHQRLADVRAAFDLRDIVYVVRDVRDVIVSGAHYFSFRSRTVAGRLSRAARWLRPPTPEEETQRRVDKMLNATAEGDRHVSRWCATAWDAHVREYLNAGAFVLRYEDMVVAPERESARLLLHLGLRGCADRVRAAIARQSFDCAKRRFAMQGDQQRAAFLRRGSPGTWIDTLTPAQSAFCTERFAPTLERLGYLEPSVATRRVARSR